MLKKLKLHNFRTFLNAEIDFTQRHLLIGKNNSGKTNLCIALRFLSTAATGDLAAMAREIPGGVGEITNWATKSEEFELSCTCQLPFEGADYDFTYSLTLKPEPSHQHGQVVLRVLSEQLWIDDARFSGVPLLGSDGQSVTMLHEEAALGRQGDASRVVASAPQDATMLSRLYEQPGFGRALLFRRCLSNWAHCAFSPEHMRQCRRQMPSAYGGLSTRGDNLATALYHLKNIDESRYRRVINHTHVTEPHLEAINFVPAPNQPPVPYVALRNQPRASWEGLSDGTLRTLGLALIIEYVSAWQDVGAVPRAPLVMIEEPENGLYPGQLRKIFDLFEEWAPEGQFIFTSHNPYFIDFFDGHREAVTVLRRKGERTEILPAPRAEEGPDRLTLSEQYSMELID